LLVGWFSRSLVLFPPFYWSAAAPIELCFPCLLGLLLGGDAARSADGAGAAMTTGAVAAAGCLGAARRLGMLLYVGAPIMGLQLRRTGAALLLPGPPAVEAG
jgi:hypothetical protein